MELNRSIEVRNKIVVVVARNAADFTQKRFDPDSRGVER